MEFYVTMLGIFLLVWTLLVYTEHSQVAQKDNIRNVNGDSDMTRIHLLQDNNTGMEQNQKQNI